MRIGDEIQFATVKMDQDEFIKEHKKLVRLLRKGKRRELKKEAADQAKELQDLKGEGGGGSEWFETYIGITPIPSQHPPSLKNPIDVRIPTAQDNWRTSDRRAAALDELNEIHKRLRRQIGKPELAHVAVGAPPGWFS